jgi:hypothetical protein
MARSRFAPVRRYSAVGVIFIAALGALAGGLVIFLREIYLATRTLRIGPH